jgi:hypothetical protein
MLRFIATWFADVSHELLQVVLVQVAFPFLPTREMHRLVTDVLVPLVNLIADLLQARHRKAVRIPPPKTHGYSPSFSGSLPQRSQDRSHHTPADGRFPIPCVPPD